MTKIPKILDAKPEPTHTIHSFHGRQLMVWEGFADPTKIEGWVSNPRLELELKRFKNKFAGREPGQEEILEIMLGDKSFGLKTLAEHIHKTGSHHATASIDVDRPRHHQHTRLRQGRRPIGGLLGSAGALPQADGTLGRIRQAGAVDRRERLPQRRDHPTGRRPALPAEVTSLPARERYFLAIRPSTIRLKSAVPNDTYSARLA